MAEFEKLLEQQIEADCSDLHLLTDEPPFLRYKNGALNPIKDAAEISKTEIEKIIVDIIGDSGLAKLKKEKEVDFAIERKKMGRFRITFYQENHGPAIAIRSIPFEIPTPKQIEIPAEVLERVSRNEGLILITGPTGAGKSTTLASLIDYINANRCVRIVTIEDPIEFVFKRKKAVISQRAVGIDAENFAKAIKHTVRQDADVIVVGEMRDLETIQTAITLAETGHLVLATLHTDDAPRAIQRIVDVFPGDKQKQIALQLSQSLSTIMSQRLIPKKDGSGRVCVREIMFNNSGIANAIRERNISEIYSQIQINGECGMKLFDESLLGFVQNGEIDPEEAYHSAHDQIQMLQRLKVL
ncbi:PilT/PilU family type 4a pilus ATPase [Candidatus Gracilibacteria bacterium]|nr:PilT/PilU family type 4a pilus ATPase [Candidatus Gracilibacteria bacterium]MCF7856506.1 PilT/PilU family type 4a pilus ATPase [Candidatus Gracilibacteria bacterium]MCF7896802.1 PilT/PilU family type 4a pilus ATPase [Candidatus Gracilibacteria bacterium]